MALVARDLAEVAGLSPTPCWLRLRKLEQAGIIAGYHARLSPRKSFELWQTTVRGRARAWSELHLESARNLRVLIELMERKRDEVLGSDSMFMWMSSSLREKTNWPLSISDRIVSSP